MHDLIQLRDNAVHARVHAARAIQQLLIAEQALPAGQRCDVACAVAAGLSSDLDALDATVAALGGHASLARSTPTFRQTLIRIMNPWFSVWSVEHDGKSSVLAGV